MQEISMSLFNRFLAATFLGILFSGVALAMEIRQFDKMAGQDQDEFIAELVKGAERVLTDDGRPDDAAKVSKLFTTNAPDGNISIGMSQFMVTLALVRLNDAKNAVEHPNDPRLEVEDAMFLTLQKNHISLPDSFFTVNKNFKPKLPPKKEKKN
jgi:hypothetical protein